jgi:hypothetical protein
LLLLPKGLSEDSLIGDDVTRSPRALLALAHYWNRLGKDATSAGRHATVELADAIVHALGKRLGEGSPVELPLYPAFRHSTRK